MKAISEALMLKRLYFGCSEPMAWWKSYSYSLDTKQGKVYFLSSYAEIDKKNDRKISEMEVPISVLENLSEIARAGGAVGSPKWENSNKVMDAPMYDYDLYWTDGTRTGPGTAAKHIMRYLQILEKKCAEAALLCEPLPENTGKEVVLFLKKETAQPPISKNSDGQPQEMWTCAICGGTESTEKFCMECGAKKTD